MSNIKAMLRNETTSSANNKLRKNGFNPITTNWAEVMLVMWRTKNNNDVP